LGDVGPVEARARNLDQHIAFAGNGTRDVADNELVTGAWAYDANGFHDFSLFKRRTCAGDARR